MNEKKDIVRNNKKLIGIIVGSIAFVLLVAGVTYAWLTWTSRETALGGTTGTFSIAYNKGGDISNLSLLPVSDYSAGESTWVAIKKNNNSIDGVVTITLNITAIETVGNCYTATDTNYIQTECMDTWDNVQEKCVSIGKNSNSSVTNTSCYAVRTWNSETSTCSNTLFVTEEECNNGLTYFEQLIDLGYINYAVYPGVITYDGSNIANVTKEVGSELIAVGTLETNVRDAEEMNANINTYQAKLLSTAKLMTLPSINLKGGSLNLVTDISLGNDYNAYVIYLWLSSEAGNEFTGTSIVGNISASATQQQVLNILQ